MASTPLTSLLTSFDPDDHRGRIMSAARDHLGLEVSFVSEFDGGQRAFRYAAGDLQRFEVRRDRMRRAIAATFSTLAASLGIRLVAEGIETAEDQEALEILGLSAGQGFLIGKPMPLTAQLTGLRSDT